MRAQNGTLIIATSAIRLANRFFGTFISLRIAAADFGPSLSGLVLSSYFAGFVVGAVNCSRNHHTRRTHPCLCRLCRVGRCRNDCHASRHRSAAMARDACPCRLGCAGIFVTTESWLSAKADPAERGRCSRSTWSAHSRHWPLANFSSAGSRWTRSSLSTVSPRFSPSRLS